MVEAQKADQEEIRRAVKDHCAEKARADQLCCGPESAEQEGEGCCGESLYDPLLQRDLPGEVTEVSLGCGDPVTLAGLQPGEVVLDLGNGTGIRFISQYGQAASPIS